MAEPFLSEIRIMSFNFPPQGWALCNGQLLPINQNQALFALLGTTYGGNGQTNFALPNFRGRVPIHTGSGHTLGESAGSSATTITLNQMPTHQHAVNASNADANNSFPNNSSLFANTKPSEFYSGIGNESLSAEVITSSGGSQAHTNMQPYLTLSFCIALQGIFPSQN